MDSVLTLTKKLLVSNRCGIHLRVAAMLAKTGKEFDAAIKIRKGSYLADGTSILDLLSLGAFQGDPVVLEVSGTDAQAAMDAIVALFEARFYEDGEGEDGENAAPDIVEGGTKDFGAAESTDAGENGIEDRQENEGSKE